MQTIVFKTRLQFELQVPAALKAKKKSGFKYQEPNPGGPGARV